MKASESCAVCGRDPQRMNSDRGECSHVDCPHRRRAWSDRQTPTTPAPKRRAEPANLIDEIKGDL